MKILLCIPPTGLFIRDERCQISVKSRVAENVREPVQLLYFAGFLIDRGFDVSLADYAAENKGVDCFLNDVKIKSPDFVFMESAQGTFKDDLLFIEKCLAVLPSIVFVLKTPFLDRTFFEETLTFIPEFKAVSKVYFVTKSYHNVVLDLLNEDCLVNKNNHFFSIQEREISEHGTESSEPFGSFDVNICKTPPRYLLNQKNYCRPDNKKSIAYPIVSIGCSYSCIFCSAPNYLGQRVQQRSVDSVLTEIEDCVNAYKIHDFFFRADTFTLNEAWVTLFCNEIIARNLEISWGTNSRVDTINSDMLQLMKRAGCEIIGFGVESGSDSVLEKIGKGISTVSIEYANKITKQAGIKTFFHLIVGFPWDTKETVCDTQNFVLECNPDFIEVNVPYPLRGTKLYQFAERHSLFVSKDFSKYSHAEPILNTFSLSAEEVSFLRKKLLKNFYFRWAYVFKKIKSMQSPIVFWNFFMRSIVLMKKLYFR